MKGSQLHIASGSPLLDRRFLVLETIGHGGMSRVYRAFDRARECMVAVKAPVPGQPARILAEEFRVWTSLRHPNVLRPLEFRRAWEGPLPRGAPYLVLEHFAGRPVHRVLTPGVATWEELGWFAGRLLRALAHVHDRGLVHRDIKPGNVLVRANGRGRPTVKLTDFGLSEHAGRRGEAGKISGSIPYVAPETICGGRIDGRADLYGVGVLLFYLASGRLPFRGDTVDDALAWHLQGEPADPAEYRGDAPASYRRVCRRLTARGAGDRPRDARAALDLLESRRGTVRSRRAARPEIEPDLRTLLDRVRVAGPLVVQPPETARDEGWHRRLRFSAHLLGVSWYEIGRPGDPDQALARVVQEMLISRDESVQACLSRHGLGHLPLEVLGGLPVWDRVRAGRRRDDPSLVGLTAAGVAALVAEQSRREPLALFVRGAAIRSRLVRETVRQLSRRLEKEPESRCLLIAPDAN